MKRRVVKVRLYPTNEEQQALSKAFGCSRWWWNYALKKTIQTYQETGKGLSDKALNSLLPQLKKEYEWLKQTYSQVYQSTTRNLSRAFINFFEKRAAFPRFKSRKARQSIQYPQSVKIEGGYLKVPFIGLIEAKFHRVFEGEIKTVTISKEPSGKYFASILFETEGDEPDISTEGKIAGVDLGLKDFAIVHDGEKTSKFANPKHLAKHERNLARKQAKLARKQKGSNKREKARKLAARVYERVRNVRQDFLHKLSRKLVDDNQVIVVENLNVKGMVRNHNLAKAISDVGWGMFVNFLSYKLERKGGKLVEIDRWFPSSKLCSKCLYQIGEMPLDVRNWTCPSCGTHHNRDENAAKNIRAEGIRLLWALGISAPASGGDVRPKFGRKPKQRHSPVMLEASTVVGTPTEWG
jgi:putative transposase